MSRDEAQLVAVHIADTCHHPLIEQRLGQRSVRIAGQVRRREMRIPIVAEQVGTQVGDRIDIVLALQYFEHPEIDACRLNIARLQDDPIRYPALLGLLTGLTFQLPSIFDASRWPGRRGSTGACPG